MRPLVIRWGAEPWGAGWCPVVRVDGKPLVLAWVPPYDRDYAEALAEQAAGRELGRAAPGTTVDMARLA